jgi:integrase
MADFMRKCYAEKGAFFMASLHRQPGRPFYFCAYSLPDGKRAFRSTGTGNRREAERIMQSWVQAAREASNDLLTVDRAREIIEHGVADIYRSASGEAMPDSTLGAWIDRWIESKKLETTPATLVRYENTLKGFRAALAGKLSKPVASITAQDILKWRDARGKTVAAKTINVDLKTIRALFGEAVRAGLVTVNVAGRVKVLKQRETSRRAFTIPEINRLIKKAEGELKGLVVFGIFTGQRLGDIARLSWRSLDLDNNEIRFLTAKTGKRLAFPLLRPLADYVATLDAPNDPDAPLFPNAYASVIKEGRVVTLSNQFHNLMAEAGLVEKRTHVSEGKGRGAKRAGGQISFHSLRHSTVTMLKKAGVSDAMTQQIIGHDSIAVSRGYTHLDGADVAKAMTKIEDML